MMLETARNTSCAFVDGMIPLYPEIHDKKIWRKSMQKNFLDAELIYVNKVGEDMQ